MRTTVIGAVAAPQASALWSRVNIAIALIIAKPGSPKLIDKASTMATRLFYRARGPLARPRRLSQCNRPVSAPHQPGGQGGIAEFDERGNTAIADFNEIGDVSFDDIAGGGGLQFDPPVHRGPRPIDDDRNDGVVDPLEGLNQLLQSLAQLDLAGADRRDPTGDARAGHAKYRLIGEDLQASFKVVALARRIGLPNDPFDFCPLVHDVAPIAPGRLILQESAHGEKTRVSGKTARAL